MEDMRKKTHRTVLECITAGTPLDHIPVLDLHTHMGSSSRHYYVPRSGKAQIQAYFDRYGIDHALTFALSPTTDPEVKNNSIYTWTDQFPLRFSALTALHAAFPEDWRALLEQGAARGSRGIKLLSDYQGVDELKSDYSEAFDFAEGRGWIVLNHDWKTEEHLAEYAESYPGISFVIGHPSLPMKKSGNVLEKYGNVYQSTCAAFVVPGFSCYSTEDLYNGFPLEKILFGSDAVDLDLGTAIGPVAYAQIPEKAKEQILGWNALGLAARIGWDLKHIEERYIRRGEER